MDVNHGTELGGKACGGKAREGLVHNGDRAYLFLGEFVGPFEIVDLDLAGIGRGPEILRLRVAGVYGGEKLINFLLGQNFGQNGILYTLWYQFLSPHATPRFFSRRKAGRLLPNTFP
jgi:hypothetical protein